MLNWYLGLPSLGASQQQVWLNTGKRSRNYSGVKIKFFVISKNPLICEMTSQKNFKTQFFLINDFVTFVFNVLFKCKSYKYKRTTMRGQLGVPRATDKTHF